MWGRHAGRVIAAARASSSTTALVAQQLMQPHDVCMFCGVWVDTSRPGGWTSNGSGDYWHDRCVPNLKRAIVTDETEQETGHYQVHLGNGQTWSSELDITLEIRDNGVLLVLDPERYEIAMFAPTGWTHVVWVADTAIDEA